MNISSNVLFFSDFVMWHFVFNLYICHITCFPAMAVTDGECMSTHTSVVCVHSLYWYYKATPNISKYGLKMSRGETSLMVTPAFQVPYKLRGQLTPTYPSKSCSKCNRWITSMNVLKCIKYKIYESVMESRCSRMHWETQTNNPGKICGGKTVPQELHALVNIW